MDNTKENNAIDLSKEVSNLMNIANALEKVSIVGSEGNYIFGSCVKSLNATVGNLIKYIQEQGGDTLGADTTSK